MSLEQLPLSSTSQWQERRGFERLYFNNPWQQAKFVKSLLGFRQTLTEFHTPNVEEQLTISAINTVINVFVETYPEFLESDDQGLNGEPYQADPQLLILVEEIRTNE